MSDQVFHDPLAEQLYAESTTEVEAAQSADTVLRKADACAQADARADIMQSAFYYLAAAHFLEHRDSAGSAQAYHQAGQQLHRLQQYTLAGRAFSNSGRLAELAAKAAPEQSDRHHLQHLAVRGYSRANHCFAEVGELEWSEAEYLNERNARLAWARMQGKHPWAQLAWKATANYGTSLSRWALWVLGTIGIFSLLYELFFQLHWLRPMENNTPALWIPVWSGFYYSVNVTAALGLVDYQPSNAISQSVVIVNVLIGYILLGIGIGIIGRMIRTR